MMFLFSCGHSDKEGRQQGENVCLQECHQQLNAVHEQHKEDGDRCYSTDLKIKISETRLSTMI